MDNKIHSKAYHRYFEGYAEKYVTDDAGNMKVMRVYAGNYYKQSISDKARICVRLAYAVLFVFTAAAYVYAGVRAVSCIPSRYVELPIAVSLLLLIYLAMSVFYSLTASREMEIRVYRESSEALKRASLSSAIVLALSAVIDIVLALITNTEFSSQLIVCIAVQLLSGISSMGIYLIESRIKYDVLPPKHPVPSRSSPIKRFSDF